jgi:hypothetical protein
MPIDELKTKYDKSAKKSKVSVPIKELKTDYEEPTRKIKQDAEGLEPVSIRVRKTKKIPIDNQIKNETKPSKLFDDGVRKTYRRKKTQTPNQKYRRYKSKVEAKLYENLVGEPEQSIVEAIREATEQLKAPSIRKIIRDANIDNQDLDASEIRTENDVRQPKRLNVKQKQNKSNQEELNKLYQKIEQDLEGGLKRQPFNKEEAEAKLPRLQSALIRLNQKNILEDRARKHGVVPTFENLNRLDKQQEEEMKKKKEEQDLQQIEAAKVIQRLVKQKGRPKGSKDKAPRKNSKGTNKPFEIETASPIPTATNPNRLIALSLLAKRAQAGISPSLGKKLIDISSSLQNRIAHRLTGDKAEKLEKDLKKQQATPRTDMLQSARTKTKPSPRVLTYSPP